MTEDKSFFIKITITAKETKYNDARYMEEQLAKAFNKSFPLSGWSYSSSIEEDE